MKYLLAVLSLLALVMPARAEYWFWVYGTNDVQLASNAPPSEASGTLYPDLTIPASAITRTFRVIYDPLHSTVTVNQASGSPHFSTSTNDGGGASYRILNVNVSFDPLSEGVHDGQVIIADSRDTHVMNVAGSSPGVLMTNFSPVNAARAVATSTNLSAWFTDRMSGSSLSNRFKAWGRQSGLIRGVVSTNGTSGTLNPASDFRPGEPIFATLESGIMNAAVQASVTSACTWSFRARVNGASIAFFGDSGRRLGSNDTRAVALGDVNRDGWLDLFVANYTGGCEVWTNNRAGVLCDSGQRLATGRNAMDVSLGDLDNDGDLDAFVVNWMAASRVWLNDGTGAFSSGDTMNGSNPGRASVLGDFDRDGDLDVVIVNDGGSNSMWRNGGSAVFPTDPSAYLGSSAGQDAAVGDINGDHTLDVIIASSNGSSVVWVNDGFGAFTSNTTLAAGTSIDLGDVDGDNDLDVLLGRGTSTARLYRNTSGSFSSIGNLTGNGRVVQMGDLDGDGDLDLARLRDDGDSSAWLNNGAATMSEVTGQTFGAFSSPKGMDLGDLDNDGDLDAVLALGTNGVRVFWNTRPSMQVYGTNGVLLTNNASPSLTKGTDFGVLTGGRVTNTFLMTNASPVNLEVPSFGMEGTMSSQFQLLDAPGVIGPWTTFVFRVAFEPVGSGLQSAQLVFDGFWPGTPFRINLQGTYAPPLIITNTTPHNGSNPVSRVSTISAQFNAPVNPATVTTNSFKLWSSMRGPLGGTVSVDGLGLGASFTPTAPFAPGETVFAEVTDAVTSSNGTAHLAPEVWSFTAEATNGTGVFYLRRLQATDPDEGPSDVILGDFDGDGDLDGMISMLQTATTQSLVQVFLNDGTGGLTNSHGVMFPAQGHNAFGLAVGDLDGDGDLDAVLGFYDHYDSPCALLWNDGQARFTVDTNAFNTGGGYPSVGDLDGDGDLDVVLEDDMRSVTPWFNDGAGHFTSGGAQLSLTQEPAETRLADLDGDGDLDILINEINGNGPSNGRTFLLMNNGIGQFTAGQVLSVQNFNYSLEPGDVDGDGDIDLVLQGRTNSCWLNDGVAHFTESPLFAGSTSYTPGLGLGDLDADGDLDVLLTTYPQMRPCEMLNDGHGTFAACMTPCKATGLYCVATGDLDGNGSLDVFCANGWGVNHQVLLNLSPARQIPLIDLALSLTLDQFTTNMGDALQFTLRLTNSGPDDATGLVVQNFCLPTNGLRYLSCSGGAFNPSNGLWSTTKLDVGTATSVQFTALVTFTGNMQQVTQVYAANEYDTDSTPSNYPVAEDDMASLSFTIANAADIEITVTASNLPPVVGSNIMFNITTRNLGPMNSTYAITNELILPAGLAYVSQTQSGSTGPYNPTNGRWNVYNLVIPGSPSVMKITACVTNQGVFTNRARVDNSYFHDPYLANNTSTVVISTWPMIRASAGAHGTISPSGEVYVETGSNASFVVTADPYYWVDSLLTNGSPTPDAAHAHIYTSSWNDVRADGTVSVSFAEAVAALGTPEWWLAQYGWTNDFDIAETNDTDGDSFFAWQEQIAGTDPTVSTSFFQCLEISSTNFPMLGKVLRWTAASGRVYSIDGSTDLPAGWFGLASNLPPVGVWTDTVHGADRVIDYRLGVEKN